MLLMNTWYVAALSREIGRSLFARTLCNRPVLLYRTQDGDIVALEDRCPHRAVPLSLGHLEGDSIRCGYHGLVFDHTGVCTRVPGQSNIPKTARVPSFPVVERWGWIWIWMGDPALADPAQIPSFPWYEDPSWDAFQLHFHLKASYLLALDNLMDLSHISYVHSDSLGTNEYADTPAVTTVEEARVLNDRRLPDVPTPPLVAEWGGFGARIYRHSYTEWTPPTNVVITTTYGDAAKEIKIRVVHPITPETDRSSHMWFSWMRNFRVGDKSETEKAIAANTKVVMQDVVFLEAQQRLIEAEPERALIAVKADAGLIGARRILGRMHEAEAASRAPSAPLPLQR
jgi:vanillate O-demethylase monooxygenase subunit